MNKIQKRFKKIVKLSWYDKIALKFWRWFDSIQNKD